MNYVAQISAWATLDGTDPDVVTFTGDGACVEVTNWSGTDELWVSAENPDPGPFSTDCVPISPGCWRAIPVARARNTEIYIAGNSNTYGAVLHRTILDPDRGANAPGIDGGGTGTVIAAGIAATAPGLGVGSTNVQAALDELAAERSPRGLLTIAASAFAGPVDLTGVSHVVVTLDANLANFAVTFPAGPGSVLVEFVQDATGNRTVTWLAGNITSWVGGQVPIIDGAANARTLVVIDTPDGGTTKIGAHGQRIDEVCWSRDGNAVATTTAPRWRSRGPARILSVVATVATAPTGQALIVDVNKNGASCWAGTPANRPTIAIGATSSGVVTNMDANTTLVAGDLVSVDVDQIGTTAPGVGLSVQVRMLML